jgi:hypothetical protein
MTLRSSTGTSLMQFLLSDLADRLSTLFVMLVFDTFALQMKRSNVQLDRCSSTIGTYDLELERIEF